MYHQNITAVEIFNLESHTISLAYRTTLELSTAKFRPPDNPFSSPSPVSANHASCRARVLPVTPLRHLAEQGRTTRDALLRHAATT